MLDLGTLGGSSSSTKAINALGQVAGDSFTTNDRQRHGFFFDGTILSDVGTFGGTSSQVNGLNDSSQVIGYATTTNDAATHAFLYSGGVLRDLGTLGGSLSIAAAINNCGQVVGTSSDANETSRAFLWEAGTITDLNNLLPPNSGWVLQSASLINDAGQIVGLGTTNGSSSLFLLTLPARCTPIANAGTDQTAECGTTVMLDGSGSISPNGNPLTYEWRENNLLLATGVTPSVSLGLGSHSIVLTVTDSQGATSQATVTVTIVDRTPPTVTCPETLVASAGTDSQAPVPDILGGVTASDACTPAAALLKTQSPAAGTLVGIGSHNITVTVTDGSTNRNTCTTTFIVQAESDKITICHKGRIRITVSSKALDAHLAHGDHVGPCTGEGP
jgi:probable HAF family extracellular repeat protein